MSHQNRPLIVGLVSPGLFWLVASVAAGQQPPSPQGRPANPAPTSSSTVAALLMSNGTVVTGDIVDDPAGGVYRLRSPGGSIPIPKSGVKRAGRSLEDLYRYLVAALPPGDADERLKLVRWCLTQGLPDLAREQLAAVLEICPDDPQAKLMAANLAANAANRDRDAAISRTSGEVPGDQPPAALPPGIAKMLPKHFGNALPEIFDLPPAVAVRRASEFAEYVQPVLQANCASCHNEKYEGDFQLVAMKSAKDRRNPDIARANLDAVLRLVNPDDPARSEILSAGLVPHGGTRKAAIFRGANDRQYQILATWVRSVRPKATANGRPAAATGGEGVSRVGYVPPEATDGFASDRSERASTPSGTGVTVDKASPLIPAGAGRKVYEYNESADFSGGRATDFPVFDFNQPGGKASSPPAKAPATAASRRPAGSAPLPPLPTGKGVAAKPPAAPAGGADADADLPEAATLTSTTVREVSPGVVAVDADADPNNLPGMGAKYPPFLKAAAGPADDAKPGSPPAAKKKAKVDPALLEQMIRTRNAGTP